MKIDGRCHCGYVSYEAEIDPEKIVICHCADCQTLSGSAFRTVALTREDAFRLRRASRRFTSRAAKAAPSVCNPFALNAEHPFIHTPASRDARRD